MNDIFRLAQDDEDEKLHLESYRWERRARFTDETAVTNALDALLSQLPHAVKLAKTVAGALQDFDWRVSSAVPRNDTQFDRQASYRGSGGYKALRQNALEHLRTGSAKTLISRTASRLLEMLGYESQEAE